MGCASCGQKYYPPRARPAQQVAGQPAPVGANITSRKFGRRITIPRAPNAVPQPTGGGPGFPEESLVSAESPAVDTKTEKEGNE